MEEKTIGELVCSEEEQSSGVNSGCRLVNLRLDSYLLQPLGLSNPRPALPFHPLDSGSGQVLTDRRAPHQSLARRPARTSCGEVMSEVEGGTILR